MKNKMVKLIIIWQ